MCSIYDFPYTVSILTNKNVIKYLYYNKASTAKAPCKPYCKTRYVSIFPLYVKAFGLSKIEQNGKEKLYLNICGLFYIRKA